MDVLGEWQSENGPTWEVNFRDLDEELRFLRAGVTKWRGAPLVRETALAAIRADGVEMRDKKSQAIAIGQWVQDNIYYVHELPERFATPAETLRSRAGDCDDGAWLIGAMLESVGIPSKLVTMKLCTQSRVPFTKLPRVCSWRHIFPAAVMQPSGALLPLDWTLKNYKVREIQNPIHVSEKRGDTVTLKIA